MLEKIIGIFRILKKIFYHPLTKKQRTRSILNFFFYNISRFFNNKIDIIVPWVENSKLIIGKADIQLRWCVYTGMSEFEDMFFLLHTLKKNNLFIDVGANVGSYTILASKVIGANSICFEPINNTSIRLKNNLTINEIDKLTTLINKAVGSKIGKLYMSARTDTGNVTNRVYLDDDIENSNLIEVEVTTLDCEIKTEKEYIIKIDVEGYEHEVIKGNHKVLKDSKLIALIIENNKSSDFYNYKREEIHELIMSFNLFPIMYNPFTRKIEKKNNFKSTLNTIYVRDINKIQQKCVGSKKFKINTANNYLLI